MSWEILKMIPARMPKCQNEMCQLRSKKGFIANLFVMQVGKKSTIFKKTLLLAMLKYSINH